MTARSDLMAEVEVLEAAAQSCAGRHEYIDELIYPEGVRIAVNFTHDFDAMLLRRVFEDPPMQLAQGEFAESGG